MKTNDLIFSLKSLTYFIIEQTYKKDGYNAINKYANFNLVLKERILTSRLGCYIPSLTTIELSSVNRIDFNNLYLTLLHELAHHIEYCKFKSTSHSANFYEIYADLLYTTIDCHFFTLDELITLNKGRLTREKTKVINILNAYIPKDKKDIKKSISLDFITDYNKTLKPIKEVIKIKCSSEQGKIFKSLGYKWDKEEKTWQKSFYYLSDFNSSKALLEDYGFVYCDFNGYKYYCNEIQIKIEGDTYKHKDTLKELGYKYNSKYWYKQISCKSIKTEYKKIRHISSAIIKPDFPVFTRKY